MGSAQSLFTPQNVLAAAIFIGVVVSVWYNHVNASVNAPGKASSAKKGKKKRVPGRAQDTSGTASDKEKGHGVASLPIEPSVPGGIPTPAVEVLDEGSKPSKEKKRKGKKSAMPAPPSADAQTPSVAGPSAVSSNSEAATSVGRSPAPKREESWTRVESRRRASGQNATAASDTGVTTASMTEEDGSSSGVTEKSVDTGTPRPQKTLAEKSAPKARKASVHDMPESSSSTEPSLVTRITPSEHEKPVSGFTWEDYGEVEDTRGADADGEDDGGWGVVKSRGKAKHSQSYQSASVAPQPKASETLTKKQRQNAAKREAAKTAKADAEADRQARLAKHKREIEHARITEHHNRKGGGGTRNNLSGGMSATVNEKGHLVWD